MPRVTCRCGQELSIPVDGPERVVCPQCSAKIRVRRSAPRVGSGEGFIRFACVCGRKLKVRVIPGVEVPEAGKCPDCGAVVPVPQDAVVTPGGGSGSSAGPNFETPTEELNAEDLATLDAWARSHLGPPTPEPVVSQGLRKADAFEDKTELTSDPAPPRVPQPVRAATKIEAGLRVCPRCGRPVHLGADACRECGAHVPRR